jgi:hypothetical protein
LSTFTTCQKKKEFQLSYKRIKRKEHKGKQILQPKIKLKKNKRKHRKT